MSCMYVYIAYVSRQERTSTILNDCSDDYRGRFSTLHDYYYVRITLVCCAVSSGNSKSKKFFLFSDENLPAQNWETNAQNCINQPPILGKWVSSSPKPTIKYKQFLKI